MEYSITNMFAEKMTEDVYVKAFAEGVETEQREHMPLVSVLLASYNHEKYVEAAVRSVMEQKGVDFELVVIDDGSTDHSPDILEKLQGELGFRYIHRENKGFVPTMNELLSLARGKYFCSFASDDIMPPDRLKKQSDFMERHPRSVACFGQIKTLSPEGDVSAEVVPLYMKNVPEVSFEQVLVSDRARRYVRWAVTIRASISRTCRCTSHCFISTARSRRLPTLCAATTASMAQTCMATMVACTAKSCGCSICTKATSYTVPPAGAGKPAGSRRLPTRIGERRSACCPSLRVSRLHSCSAFQSFLSRNGSLSARGCACRTT